MAPARWARARSMGLQRLTPLLVRKRRSDHPEEGDLKVQFEMKNQISRHKIV